MLQGPRAGVMLRRNSLKSDLIKSGHQRTGPPERLAYRKTNIMFKRRNRRSRLELIRTLVWPARGFGRLFSYILQRVKRMSGTPTSIAIGAAWGVSVSFSPFIGLHLLLGMMLAFVTRGNMLACLFGTLVGNPWTFPLFFYLEYQLGSGVIWFATGETSQMASSMQAFIGMFLANPAATIGILFAPILVGCLIFGIIAWFATFGFVYWAVKGWREHRKRRLAAVRRLRASDGPRNDNDAMRRVAAANAAAIAKAASDDAKRGGSGT